MKVLDLQCAHKHVFEGWFASETDFQDQHGRGLVECPVCGNATIVKMLSAPRLNFGNERELIQPSQEVARPSVTAQSLHATWMEVARLVVANTDDVGDQFAEEARRIHYGEAEERGIRGKASRDETASLIEEGIAVMPLGLPEFLKGPIQ
ncbi:MAG: DUF1178 family protein [Burkholderiales bacterium]|jgi:hypothetical protein|nr:DUF1178 family protein [Burkholderiales bacterium]